MPNKGKQMINTNRAVSVNFAGNGNNSQSSTSGSANICSI